MRFIIDSDCVGECLCTGLGIDDERMLVVSELRVGDGDWVARLVLLVTNNAVIGANGFEPVTRRSVKTGIDFNFLSTIVPFSRIEWAIKGDGCLCFIDRPGLNGERGVGIGVGDFEYASSAIWAIPPIGLTCMAAN